MNQTNSCISTYSGRFFDILKPEEYDYDIEEIAHALSNICRYTGHVNKFYSVAEHSVLVSHIVPRDLALVGLLHDASEAYLGDVAKPLKNLLPEYEKIEESVEVAIAKAFGIPFPYPKCIKEADRQMYWQERQEIADNGIRDRLWNQNNRATRRVKAQGLNPRAAKTAFLARFKNIMKEQ